MTAKTEDAFKFQRWRDTPHGKTSRKAQADWYRLMRKVYPIGTRAFARFVRQERRRLEQAIIYDVPYK